jgi:hypothetical protein
MNVPGPKALSRITDNPEELQRILRDYSLEELQERFPTLDEWVRRCYHEPSDEEQRLHAADCFLGTGGVEGQCSGDGRSGYSYCNTGESYDDTLILTRHGNFRVGCMANARF